MRLTLPLFQSTSDTGTDETVPETDQTESLADVTIHENAPTCDDAQGTVTVEEVVPDSDVALLVALRQMDTPATVDEVTDRLLGPVDPSVDTWADVHERLYQTRLPELDAVGMVDFDPEQGTVTVPEVKIATQQGRSTDRSSHSFRTLLVILCVVLGLSVLAAAIAVGVPLL